jgi:hypothetical protein
MERTSPAGYSFLHNTLLALGQEGTTPFCDGLRSKLRE